MATFGIDRFGILQCGIAATVTSLSLHALDTRTIRQSLSDERPARGMRLSYRHHFCDLFSAHSNGFMRYRAAHGVIIRISEEHLSNWRQQLL